MAIVKVTPVLAILSGDCETCEDEVLKCDDTAVIGKLRDCEAASIRDCQL